jgi:sugar lactone lactonase YvrE
MKIANVCYLVFVLFIVSSISSCGGNSSNSNSSVSVTTIAGAKKWADGIGSAASFNYPKGVTSDGTALYVTDAMNHTIRKIVISSGEVSTLAGSPGSFGSSDGVGPTAQFYDPIGITTDGTYLYVVDSGNGTIRKINIASGAVTTLAGTAHILGAADGVGSSASFFAPVGITTDGTNLYVTDNGNGKIRKIVISTGTVTTLPVNLNFPSTGITTNGTNLYVTNDSNYTIHEIVISTGFTSTFAGSAGVGGFDDGIGTSATFSGPTGITTDGVYLYITDFSVIRKIEISTKTVTTISGSHFLGSTDGSAAMAGFSAPLSITCSGTNLFVADTGNNTIRKVAISDGTVSTIAGKAASNGLANGIGASARFDGPEGITTDGTNLYVTDSRNDTIRKIVISTGEVSTIAGTSGRSGSADGTGSSASFFRPIGITTDGTNLYVADTGNETIRKIVISSGVVTTIAGTALNRGSTDGIGPSASFFSPYGIATDGTNLYVTDASNSTIRKIIIASRAVSTIAGIAGSTGAIDGIGTSARFWSPQGITFDGANLYVTDGGNNNTIRMIVVSSGVVTTIAGTAGTTGATDGIGIAARFSQPNGISTDGSNLYVADEINSTIRKMVISTGVVTTLAGSAGNSGSIDGAGIVARFNRPKGITANGTNIYVADLFNQTIRKIH